MLLESYLGQWANAVRTCVKPSFFRILYFSRTRTEMGNQSMNVKESNLFQVIFDAGLAVQMSPKAGLTF